MSGLVPAGRQVIVSTFMVYTEVFRTRYYSVVLDSLLEPVCDTPGKCHMRFMACHGLEQVASWVPDISPYLVLNFILEDKDIRPKIPF